MPGRGVFLAKYRDFSSGKFISKEKEFANREHNFKFSLPFYEQEFLNQETTVCGCKMVGQNELNNNVFYIFVFCCSFLLLLLQLCS